jgi:hypothetical protein
VYDAIIKRQPLYGLETIQLTQPEQQKLNAFQMKGLRRILNIPPTSIDRSWTNKKVLETLYAEHDLTMEPFDVTMEKKEGQTAGTHNKST